MKEHPGATLSNTGKIRAVSAYPIPITHISQLVLPTSQRDTTQSIPHFPAQGSYLLLSVLHQHNHRRNSSSKDMRVLEEQR